MLGYNAYLIRNLYAAFKIFHVRCSREHTPAHVQYTHTHTPDVFVYKTYERSIIST